MLYFPDRGKFLKDSSQNLDNRKTQEALTPSASKDGERMKIKSRPYNIDGKTIYISGNNEQEVSEKYAQLFLKNVQEKDKDEIATAIPSRTDFCEYAEKWLEWKIGSNKITKRTALGYRGHLNQINEFFKGKLLEEINRDQIQNFLDLYSHQAESTIKKKRIILQQIFNWGVEDKLIPMNPVVGDRIAINGKEKVKRKAVPEEKYRSLINNLNVIKRKEDQVFLALIACTGMRRGEALALKWEDIDWGSKQISINKAVTFSGNQPLIKSPKSVKGNRKVPILPQLEKVLKSNAQQDGYIVSVDGKTPFTDTMVKNSLHRIQAQADMQEYTFHCLRHSFATMMAKDPLIAPKTLQTLMGHADISTTFGMYAETESSTISEAGYLFSQQLAQ